MMLAVSIWSSVITGGAVVAGVVVGAILTWVREALARRRQAVRELDAAALHVLARTEKIARAERVGASRESEISYLGTDLDRYLAAIAGIGPKAPDRARHWKIYKAAMPIVIGHDTTNLRAVIEELRRLRSDLESEFAGAGEVA